MIYKERDRVVGEIYKDEEFITTVKFGSVSKNEAGQLQFDVTVGGGTERIKKGDECRLVTEDGETKIQLAGPWTC
jgi:hypothetical protein